MSAAALMEGHASGTARPAAASFGRVMAFLDDDVTRQAVLRVCADSGWHQPQVDMGGIEAAIERLGGGGSPDLLLVDLSASADPIADINALADVCDAGTKVIALGTVNDVKLYRALTGAGLVDYLLKPVTPVDLTHAVELAAGPVEGAARRTGSLVAVIGARGGTGASTVAAGLAWAAAEKESRKTALLDLDLAFGTGALTFDLEPGTGLAEMLADPGRIDTLFLERASVAVSERLAVFATEAPLGAVPPVHAEAMNVLLAELLGTYQLVVADIPRDLAQAMPAALTSAHKAVLVTDLSIAGMRDCLRLKAVIAEVAPGCEPMVVVGGARMPVKGDLTRAEFEKAVGLPVQGTVAYDSRAMGEVSAKGLPLATGRGKAAAELRRLAHALAGAPEAGNKRPSLARRLFGGGKTA